MSYHAYAQTKPSGFDWFGDIPTHWEFAAVWMLFSIGRGRVISHLEILEDPGPYPVYSSQTEHEGVMGRISAYDFDGDYLTWTTDGAKAGTVFRRAGKFNCTNVCGTLKAKTRETHLGFYLYAIGLATAGHVRPDINPKLMNEDMAYIRVPKPSYDEQQAIAAFLDRKTAEIDHLIHLKEQQIVLLEKKRQAVISEAVTSGLDPTVPTKTSGVDWLGNIPTHWKVKPLKYTAKKIGSGRTPQGGADVYVREGVLFLRSQNVYDDGLRLTDVACIDESTNEEMQDTQVYSGDVLLNITGASIGRTCIVPVGCL